jgi:hypothetical protein
MPIVKTNNKPKNKLVRFSSTGKLLGLGERCMAEERLPTQRRTNCIAAKHPRKKTVGTPRA